MSDDAESMLPQVQAYRQVVLRYEALDERIDKLIMDHDGSTEKMSEASLDEYRALARQRDELLNEMRIMEHDLLLSDDGAE